VTVQILFPILDQRPRLESWEREQWSEGVVHGPQPGDARDVYERVVARERAGLPEQNGPFRRIAEAILRYDIFPPWMATPVIRRAPVQVGDTLGLRYHFFFGVDIFFASKVIERIDEPSRVGFTYRTLDGHPETGEETFSVEKDMTTGEVTAALRSWSRPGMLWTRLARPLARRIQVRASNAALDHLQRVGLG
jgi:uncharacterized protein (UPF0548 family)